MATPLIIKRIMFFPFRLYVRQADVEQGSRDQIFFVLSGRIWLQSYLMICEDVAKIIFAKNMQMLGHLKLRFIFYRHVCRLKLNLQKVLNIYFYY